jgi:3-oxoacyl-[acyl-carrier-protein] synthase II
MDENKRRVAVTGVGAISPLGNDAAGLWEGVREGRSGAGPVTRFDPSRLESRIACEVKGFQASDYMDSKEARKMALFSQYAVAAAVEAWRDAGFGAEAPYPRERRAVLLGNGIGGIEVLLESERKLLESGPGRMLPMTIPLMIANEAAANLAMHFGFKGPALTTVTACASGSDAIGQALDLIRSGRADLVIAGGTEAAITEFAMGGFCRLKALSTAYNDRPAEASRPFDKARDGFVIGEGAGILVLEDWEAAKRRGARIRAELSGYGSSCDAFHLTAPDPEGEGGALALRLAIADAGLEPENIDYYNAHGTSTEMNDRIETLMLKKVFGEGAGKLAVSSTKGATGHCIAAAGALEAIVCVRAIEEGFAPPTANLEEADLESGCDLDYIPRIGRATRIEAAASGSLGFGGHNAMLVFRRAR